MAAFLWDNLMGFLLIVLGLIAGRWPQTIDTVRYTSPEKQQNVDLRGLGHHTMTGLIVPGTSQRYDHSK